MDRNVPSKVPSRIPVIDIGPLAPDSDRLPSLPQARIFYAENIWPRRPAAVEAVAGEPTGRLQT